LYVLGVSGIKKQLRVKIGYWIGMGVLQETLEAVDTTATSSGASTSTGANSSGNGSMNSGSNWSIASPFTGLHNHSPSHGHGRSPGLSYYPSPIQNQYPSPNKQHQEHTNTTYTYTYHIIENQFQHAHSLGYDSVLDYHTALSSSSRNTDEDSNIKSDDGLIGKSESNSKQMLVTCEQFIHGLLVNHKTMTLERLFSMLKMLSEASDGNGASNNGNTIFSFDMTQIQLRNHMSLMVERELVEYFDGTYSLPKQ